MSDPAFNPKGDNPSDPEVDLHLNTTLLPSLPFETLGQNPDLEILAREGREIKAAIDQLTSPDLIGERLKQFADNLTAKGYVSDQDRKLIEELFTKRDLENAAKIDQAIKLVLHRSLTLVYYANLSLQLEILKGEAAVFNAAQRSPLTPPEVCSALCFNNEGSPTGYLEIRSEVGSLEKQLEELKKAIEGVCDALKLRKQRGDLEEFDRDEKKERIQSEISRLKAKYPQLDAVLDQIQTQFIDYVPEGPIAALAGK